MLALYPVPWDCLPDGQNFCLAAGCHAALVLSSSPIHTASMCWAVDDRIGAV